MEDKLTPDVFHCHTPPVVHRNHGVANLQVVVFAWIM
jgi:hypothetical protein